MKFTFDLLCKRRDCFSTAFNHMFTRAAAITRHAPALCIAVCNKEMVLFSSWVPYMRAYVTCDFLPDPNVPPRIELSTSTMVHGLDDAASALCALDWSPLYSVSTGE
jgi:hypothetical protein